MSNAELSLQDRLAGILDAGNPFAKLASADPQLEEATAELFEEVAEVAPEAPEAVVEEAPVEEAAEKTASPSLNLNDVLASDELKAGFAAVYNDRMDEIEEAVSELF